MGVLEPHGTMSILGKDGDFKVIWNPDNQDEIDQARRSFDELRGKGFTAFSVKGKDGEKDQLIHSFDPKAARIIMVPRVAGGCD